MSSLLLVQVRWPEEHKVGSSTSATGSLTIVSRAVYKGGVLSCAVGFPPVGVQLRADWQGAVDSRGASEQA